jgi:hypothetical protein
MRSINLKKKMLAFLKTENSYSFSKSFFTNKFFTSEKHKKHSLGFNVKTKASPQDPNSASPQDPNSASPTEAEKKNGSK